MNVCSLQMKNSEKPVVYQPSQAQIQSSKKPTATPSTATPSFQPPQSEMEMPAELTTPKSSAVETTSSSQPSQEKMQTSNEMCKFNQITILYNNNNNNDNNNNNNNNLLFI